MTGIIDAQTEKEKNELRQKLLQHEGFPPIAKGSDTPRYIWDFGDTVLRLYDANHSCVMIGTVENSSGQEIECEHCLPTFSGAKSMLEAHALKSLLVFEETRWSSDDYLVGYFQKVESFFPVQTTAVRYLMVTSQELAKEYKEWYRENNK